MAWLRGLGFSCQFFLDYLYKLWRGIESTFGQEKKIYAGSLHVYCIKWGNGTEVFVIWCLFWLNETSPNQSA